MPTLQRLNTRDLKSHLFSTTPYRNINKITVFNNSVKITTGKANFFPALMPSESKRGKIQEFSQKSRYRLLLLLSRLHLQSYDSIYFLTLTYHNLYPKNLTELKYQLKKFLIYFNRKYPQFEYVWRLELQKRGAPHFHLLLLSEKSVSFSGVSQFETEIRDLWLSVIKDRNQFLELYSTRIDLMDSPSKVFTYIGKYTAKTVQFESVPNLGRRWGKSKNLIFKEITMISVSDRLLEIFKDNFLRYLDQKRQGEDRFADYIRDQNNIQFLIPAKEFIKLLESSLLTYLREVRNDERIYKQVLLNFKQLEGLRTILNVDSTDKIPA